MAIRMTGLTSGLDTEAIVGALMSAQSLKKTKIEQKKTKLEWQQEKWADLNTKLIKLYNEQVSKMQLQSSYMTKKASVSDSSKVSVTAGTKAVNGSYTLEIENIATSQYLTGAKISANSVTDKLTDIDSSLLNKEILITNGDTTKKFAVTSSTTIQDFTNALTAAGLNASYDTNQKRFFISSKESGVENAFSITTSGIQDAELDGQQAIRDAVGYTSMTTANKTIVDEAIETLQTSGVDTDEYKKALESLSKAAYETKKTNTETAASTFMKAKLYSENYDTYKKKAEESLKEEYFEEDGSLKEGKTQEAYEEAVAKTADTDTTNYVNKTVSSDSAIKVEIEAAAFSGKTEADIESLDSKAKEKYYANGVEGFDGTSTFSQTGIQSDIEATVKAYADMSDSDRYATLSESALGGLGLADIKVQEDGTTIVNGGGSVPSGMALIKASDSKIILNGAELTSSSSTVSANGLSLELTGLTKAGESITFSVSNDVDGVYNSIKNFLTEYNAIMKEMNTLYNADSSKGYEPLTKDEKEAMSDDEVELWETKIKDSLLRRDSTLNGVITSMRSAMQSQITYEGKKYSLSSFGIMTSTDFTEGGLYHIYGDTDDAVYADQTDKLKAALQDDPDAVVNVLSEIFSNLRETMSKKMAGSKVSSALTFYSDIKMKEEISDYEDEIEEWEDRLADLEDSYYSKFTAMETALAKLQSQQSSLSSLFGG